MHHIKGAINIQLFDLKNNVSFLKDEQIKLYCNTGHRAELAAARLEEHGISSSVIPLEKLESMEWESQSLVCALNYLTVKPGQEEAFGEETKILCRKTVVKKGFLGSKVFKISTISYGGSLLFGEYQEIPIQPTKYVMLTYWDSKESHEQFHKDPEILEGFKALVPYLASMPFEEFGEIIR